MTYAKFWKQTAKLSMHFLNEGLKPQQRVMIIYPITSILEYFTAFVACLRIGVVPVSIYPPNPGISSP
jgi:acyl-CoA synthetase (AMP-forming)/AMP-acid ligase II